MFWRSFYSCFGQQDQHYIFFTIFPDCHPGSKWISTKIFSHAAALPLLIHHIVLITLIVYPLWDIDIADADPVQELVYDLRSQCDAIRVTKAIRPFSMVCCPVNENSAALIVSDGRVMIWELKSSISGRTIRNR